MKKFNFTGLACIDSELSRRCMEQIARLPEMVGTGDSDDVYEYLFGDVSENVRSYGYANKLLGELGVFNCINLVLVYERERYQVVGVKFDQVDVARKCVCIFGEVLLVKSERYRKCLGEPVSKRDLRKIEAELQVYLEGLTEDFSNVVFDEYGV